MSNHAAATQGIFVSLGSGAWSRIKVQATQQIAVWLQVGKALQVGRAVSPDDESFDQWCKDNGYGDMRPEDRDAALALAEHHEAIPKDAIKEGMSHPICFTNLINQLSRK